MKNIAPNITRQRLLIEGFFNIEVDKLTIENYFTIITSSLQLKMYGKPIIFSPREEGKEDNQGYDAFAPLIDSGISVYVWSASKFLSIIIFTCKDFDEKTALKITKEYFGINKIEFKSF